MIDGFLCECLDSEDYWSDSSDNNWDVDSASSAGGYVSTESFEDLLVDYDSPGEDEDKDEDEDHGSEQTEEKVGLVVLAGEDHQGDESDSSSDFEDLLREHDVTRPEDIGFEMDDSPPPLLERVVSASTKSICLKASQSAVLEKEWREEMLPEMHNFLDKVGDLADLVLKALNVETVVDIEDTALQSLFFRSEKILHSLRTNSTGTMFLFRDGPVTHAVKVGSILVLEDFDVPSQSITERLNSLLETEPSFNVTEDSSTEYTKVKILVGTQIIATVHKSHPNQKVHLSPATRSRFTEIQLEPYTKAEVEGIIKYSLISRMSSGTEKNYADDVASRLCLIANGIISEAKNGRLSEHPLRNLLKCVAFIVNPVNSSIPLLPNRVVTASRFFLLDSSETNSKNIIQNAFDGQDLSGILHILGQPGLDDGIVVLDTRSQSSEKSTQTAVKQPSIFSSHSDTILTLRFASISAEMVEPRSDKSLPSLKVVPTTTTVLQLARMFASISARAPLLLCGPPGVGKSQICKTVAGLLNAKLTRINMSASTTIDQLFGSFIITQEGSRRVFEWQDGPLIAAVRVAVKENKSTFILIDEINLASPEVLDCLAVLLSQQGSPGGWFVLPGTMEKILLGETRFFATMNPVNIGGGRSRLPRSIQNIFTVVNLDAYDDTELRAIAHGVFSSLVDSDNDADDDAGKIMTAADVNRLFDFQRSLDKAAKRRDIGKVGGPYDFNLRELTKLRDVIYGNAADFRHQHMERVGHAISRTAIVCRCAELVYARAFAHEDDWIFVKRELERHFEVSGNGSGVVTKPTIDQTTPGIIRIGDVYVEEGSCSTSEIDCKLLVPTPETVRQLELLAVAVHSKRSILLEGPSCSRKTSLVIELARLAKRKLVVLPMNQETDVSDVIGQWLPNNQSDTLGSLSTVLDKINSFLCNAENNILLLALPNAQSVNMSTRILQSLFDVRELKALIADILSSNTISADLMKISERLGSICSALKMLFDDNEENQSEHTLYGVEGVEELNTLCSTLLEEVFVEQQRFEGDTQSTDSSGGGGGLTFTFKVSKLVEAMQEGAWCLLDNVDSCPESVVERLNSISEENRELVIYEGGDVTHVKIKPEFRLFMTSNPTRVQGIKLSGALINRVIRFCLSPIDHDCAVIDLKGVEESDAYSIVAAQLAGINGGDNVALLLVHVHREVLLAHRRGELLYSSDFAVTFRMLEHTVKSIKTLVQGNAEVVNSCFISLLSVYGSGLPHSCITVLKRIVCSAVALSGVTKVELFLTRELIVDEKDEEQTGDKDDLSEDMIEVQNRVVIVVCHLFSATLEHCRRPEHVARKSFLKRWRQYCDFFLEPILLSNDEDKSNSLVRARRNVEEAFNDADIGQSIEAISVITAEYTLSTEFLDDSLLKGVLAYAKGCSLQDCVVRFEKVLRIFKVVVLLYRLISQPIFHEVNLPEATRLQKLLCQVLSIAPLVRIYFPLLQHPSYSQLHILMEEEFSRLNSRALKRNFLLMINRKKVQKLHNSKEVHKLLTKLPGCGFNPALVRKIDKCVKFLSMSWDIGVKMLSHTSSKYEPDDHELGLRLQDLEIAIAVSDIFSKLVGMVQGEGISLKAAMHVTALEHTIEETERKIKHLDGILTNFFYPNNSEQEDEKEKWEVEKDGLNGTLEKLYAEKNEAMKKKTDILSQLKTELCDMNSSENVINLKNYNTHRNNQGFVQCCNILKSEHPEQGSLTPSLVKESLFPALCLCNESIVKSPSFVCLLSLFTSSINSVGQLAIRQLMWTNDLSSDDIKACAEMPYTLFLIEDVVSSDHGMNSIGICGILLCESDGNDEEEEEEAKDLALDMHVCVFGNSSSVDKLEAWVRRELVPLTDARAAERYEVKHMSEGVSHSLTRVASHLSSSVDKWMRAQHQRKDSAGEGCNVVVREKAVEMLLADVRRDVIWQDESSTAPIVRDILKLYDDMLSFTDVGTSSAFDALDLERRTSTLVEKEIIRNIEYTVESGFDTGSASVRNCISEYIHRCPSDKYPLATRVMSAKLRCYDNTVEQLNILISAITSSFMTASQYVTVIILESITMVDEKSNSVSAAFTDVERFCIVGLNKLIALQQCDPEDQPNLCVQWSNTAAELPQLLETLGNVMSKDYSDKYNLFEHILNKVKCADFSSQLTSPVSVAVFKAEDAVKSANDERMKYHVEDLIRASLQLQEALKFLHDFRPIQKGLRLRVMQWKGKVEKLMENMNTVQVLDKKRAIASVRAILSEIEELKSARVNSKRDLDCDTFGILEMRKVVHDDVVLESSYIPPQFGNKDKYDLQLKNKIGQFQHRLSNRNSTCSSGSISLRKSITADAWSMIAATCMGVYAMDQHDVLDELISQVFISLSLDNILRIGETVGRADMLKKLRGPMAIEFASFRYETTKDAFEDIGNSVGDSRAIKSLRGLLEERTLPQDFLVVVDHLRDIKQHSNGLQLELQDFSDRGNSLASPSCDMLPPMFNIADIAVLFVPDELTVFEIFEKHVLFNMAVSHSGPRKNILYEKARQASITTGSRGCTKSNSFFLNIWGEVLKFSDSSDKIRKCCLDFCSAYFLECEKVVSVQIENESNESSGRLLQRDDINICWVNMMGSCDIHPPAQMCLSAGILSLTRSLLQALKMQLKNEHQVEEEMDNSNRMKLRRGLNNYASDLLSGEELDERFRRRKDRAEGLDKLAELCNLSLLLEGKRQELSEMDAIDLFHCGESSGDLMLRSDFREQLQVGIKNLDKTIVALESGGSDVKLTTKWLEAIKQTRAIALGAVHLFVRSFQEKQAALNVLSNNRLEISQICQSVKELSCELGDEDNSFIRDITKSKNVSVVASAMERCLTEYNNLEKHLITSRSLNLPGLHQCLATAQFFMAKLSVCAKNRVAVGSAESCEQMTRVLHDLHSSPSPVLKNMLESMSMTTESNDVAMQAISMIASEVKPNLSAMLRCFHETVIGVTANPFGAESLLASRDNLLRSHFAKPSAALRRHVVAYCDLIECASLFSTMSEEECNCAMLCLTSLDDLASFSTTSKLSSFIDHTAKHLDPMLNNFHSFFRVFAWHRPQSDGLRKVFNEYSGELQILFAEAAMKLAIQSFWRSNDQLGLAHKFSARTDVNSLWHRHDDSGKVIPKIEELTLRDLFDHNNVVTTFSACGGDTGVGLLLSSLRRYEIALDMLRASVEDGYVKGQEILKVMASFNAAVSVCDILNSFSASLKGTENVLSAHLQPEQHLNIVNCIQTLQFPWENFHLLVAKCGCEVGSELFSTAFNDNICNEIEKNHYNARHKYDFEIASIKEKRKNRSEELSIV